MVAEQQQPPRGRVLASIVRGHRHHRRRHLERLAVGQQPISRARSWVRVVVQGRRGEGAVAKTEAEGVSAVGDDGGRAHRRRVRVDRDRMVRVIFFVTGRNN